METPCSLLLSASVPCLRRSGKSCRLRWLNYLRPNLKRGPISVEEEDIVLQLHERWGNKWSRIAQRLPGRTDNEIKNYWRTHLRKRLQVQEQGSFQSMISNAKDDFLIQKGDTSTGIGSYEGCSPVDIVGNKDDSFDVHGLSNFALASSPYENRLSDWMLGLSDDQSRIKHQGDCNSLDSCFCYPAAWASEDEESSIWECSGSLWDKD
ncbi:hypothetical protein L1049_009474 [Liquidambar formosana]|uniref:Uncharacterized protein n=1 Tax=Liquidambar formosana TaxID=63359 RepID=A0AAP0S5F8_LIQFO